MGILKDLKVKTLQDVASSCGLAKSGRKTEIYHRIRSTARDFRPLPKNVRILSIDMGIRNMAFCLLKPGKPIPGAHLEEGRKPSVQVSAWQRLSLSTSDNQNDTEETKTASIEDFSPSHMAKLAVSFIQTHVLPSSPTHILIERQRFRSANSPSINNWTIRVNSLEAMLYSALAVYQSLGKFKGEVLPVVPRTVAGFLLNENDFTSGLVRRGMSRVEAAGAVDASKKNKVDLLTRLIKHEDGLITFDSVQASSIAEGFKARGEPRSKKSKQKSALENNDVEDKRVESFTKVDDLADCLLQGIAWIEWQKNMEHLIKTEAWVTGPEEEDVKLVGTDRDDEGREKKARRRKSRIRNEEEVTELKNRTRRKQGVVSQSAASPIKKTKKKKEKD
ncbi:Mitochondrial resolvase Ydc2 / RNA splicing MRS1 domain containing protein [Naviculisporaceae sp. PSN 640]